MIDRNVNSVDHVDYGMVLGTDNKKLKSRSGDTIRLRELLDEVCTCVSFGMYELDSHYDFRGLSGPGSPLCERQRSVPSVALLKSRCGCLAS